MKHHLALLLTTMLVLTACAPTPTPSATLPPASTTAPTSRSEDGLNLLIVAQGPVLLRRENWPEFQRTAFGAVLRRGDMLRLDPGARATVLCSDLTTWAVPAGAPAGVSNGCPPPQRPALVREGSVIGTTKNPIDPLIPYIISPRMTRLLSAQPTLRWNAVSGVTTYTVAIHGVDWLTQTTATHMIYPTDAPDLQSGVTYLLWVKADNGRRSGEEGLPGLGFRLLDPDEADSVRSDARHLRNLALPAEAESYARAHLYAGHSLVAEAIDLLEGLVADGSQEAAVHRALGDLYHGIGLDRLAEVHYLEANELAKQTGDVEGQALALSSLGDVYATLGNQREALARWQQALEHYQAIGDAGQADQVQKRIDEVK